MKRQTVLVFSVVLLITQALNAIEVDSATAKKVGARYYFEFYASTKSIELEALQPVVKSVLSSSEGKPLIYFINVTPTGYLIVSGDDRAYPVLSYSTVESWSDEMWVDLPPAAVAFIQGYADQIELLINSNLSASKEVSQLWEKYLNPEKLSPIKNRESYSLATMGNLSWNQDEFYNQECPQTGGAHPAGLLGFDNRCPAGCVAVAMAQIMRYWSWPETGTGSKSYTDPSNPAKPPDVLADPSYGVQSANFGSTTYEWENMPNALSNYNSNVARIIRQAGVAANTNYSYHSSGAIISNTRNAFITNFGYSGDASIKSKNALISWDVWEGWMKAEIRGERPVYFQGFSDDGGHALVCYAYEDGDAHIKFRFNWGWGGSHNPTWYTVRSVTGDTLLPFINNQSILTGLYPKSSNLSFTPCPGAPTITIDDQTYNTVLIGNQCWMKENLNIGIMIITGQTPSNNATIEKYCYDDNPENCQIFGGLYTWTEMMGYTDEEGVQGICPAGWHIPTDDDWNILEGTVDSEYPVGDPEWDKTGRRGLDAGGSLKSPGTSVWTSPNTGATNASGFTALPGGNFTGGYGNKSNYAYQWTSTMTNPLSAYYHRYDYNQAKAYRTVRNKDYALSVRCVFDEDMILFAKISGKVSDLQSGIPIEGAVVKTLNYVSPPTTATGKYTLIVPFGYGYTLIALAEGYETHFTYNVHVPEHNPEVMVDFELPLSLGEATIVSHYPDPNPEISIVSQGAILHRYYKTINNSTGNPYPMCLIKVLGNGFEHFYISDENGDVDVEIQSGEIGSGIPGSQNLYSIVEVSGEPLPTPIEFLCKVERLNFEKYWDNHNYSKLGANLLGVDLSVEVEKGSVTTLQNGNFVYSDPEKINISRQGRAGVGVAFKIKSPGAKGQLGPIKGGVGAEAGLGTKFMGVTEDNYQFNYDITNNWQAVAQYILIADGNYKNIDNAMIRFLSILESKFAGNSTLQESFVSDGIGIDVSGNASAEGFAGIEVSKYAKVGAGGNIGYDGHVTFNAVNHHSDHAYEYNFGVNGKFTSSAGAGLKMNLDNNGKNDLNTMLNVWDTESSRGLQFSIYLDADNPDHIERFELKFIRRNLISKYEDETIYSISGDDIIESITNLTNEIHQISNSHSSSSNITVKNTTFKQILDAVFAFLYDVQANQLGQATILYQKNLTSIDHSSSFDVSLDLSITAVSLQMGGGVGFEQGKKMTIETGSWAVGKTYLNQEYTGEIPEIETSYRQVLQGIVDEVPLWLRLLIGTIKSIFRGKDDATFYIGNNGSYIIFPDDAFPVGVDSLHCSSWGWYGRDPSAKIQDLSKDSKEIYTENKKRAEQAFGMMYGFGGFYQFEPYGAELPDTCWLTIYYDQEEVDSIDEASLGMYWEDKANHQWIYLGGVLDTIENKVTSPVTQLSLFTLAPARPFGTFDLNALPDSIYADGVASTIINSDTIFNNNLTPVANGQNFTVKTSFGTIITPDADTTIDGIQVLAENHQIQFEVCSSLIGGTARVVASSVNGSARASLEIRFYDTIPPAPPVLVNIIPDSSMAKLFWLQNTENDLSGYILYFDTDTIPPFDGIHTVFGSPSPIYTGTDTLGIINGLFNDTSYYFAITSVDVEGNESDYSNFVAATPFSPVKQIIQIKKGWSGISSYLIPKKDNVVSMFESIIDDLILLQNNSGIYWPSQQINTLTTWDSDQGYLIKVSDEVELAIPGTRTNNRTLQLIEGWNLIPVLSECPLDVDALFDASDLVIVKEVAGPKVYWPDYGINTLGALDPGKAYFVLMNQNVEIVFPDCNLKSWINNNTRNQIKPDRIGFISELNITPTAATHTIATNLIGNFTGKDFENQNILGAFDEYGRCFGATPIGNSIHAITLYGDDPVTDEKDGFSAGEKITFRLVNSENTESLKPEIIFDAALPDHDAVFITNGLSAIKCFLNHEQICQFDFENRVNLSPNPADDFLTVTKDFDDPIQISISTAQGIIIYNSIFPNQKMSIDVSAFAPGIYLISLKGEQLNSVRKLIIR